MNDCPDAVLLRRYIDDGDEMAFAELVQRYLGLVYHAALRQTGGRTHAAEDIAQAVFTLLARKAASLVQHDTLVGWLHTTARYTAQFQRRRESRRIRREEEASIMHEENGPETHPADWERLRPLIDEVLAELAAADRDAILLRFFTGLPFSEIGARLKLSENAARMRVERALEKLYTRLARRGVVSTAAALGGALTTQAMASAPAGLAASVMGAALSGTAPSGALWAAGIFCMKTKPVIFTLALLLAAGTACFQFDRAQKAEASLAAANRERDLLRERLRPASPQIDKIVQNPAPVPAAPAPEVRRNGPAATPASSSEGSRQSSRAAKIAHAASQRIQSLDAQYRPLYHVLGLNAGQSARFKAILTDNARRNEELMLAALEDTSTDSVQQQRVIDDQTNAELIAAIRGEFGDAAVQAMDTHKRMFPFRAPLDEFAKTLFYTDTPLTASQAEQLLAAVVRQEQAARGKLDFEWMVQPDLYGAMLTQSSGILSAPQIDALRQITEQALGQVGSKKNKSSGPAK